MSNWILGLTGGIGSGKTTVANLFAAEGVTVVDADAIARELVAPGQPALLLIAAHFGPDVLNAAGELDRATLRRLIFAEAAQAVVEPTAASADPRNATAALSGGERRLRDPDGSPAV